MRLEKISMWKKTWTFFKRLAAAEDCGNGEIAKISGKETGTAEAWGRPPASDEFPTGTGKRNPTDLQLRLIGLAYKKHSPGLAREWAEVFPAYVDFLDDIHGIKHKRAGGTARELLARAAKEYGDLIYKMAGNADYDTKEVLRELAEFKSEMRRFEKCLDEEIKEKEAQANGYQANKSPQSFVS